MLSREEITAILQEQRPYLAAEFGVSRIGLFGSYAQNHSNAQSDIDLIVEFERPLGFKFMDLVAYLEDLFNAPVDILTPAGIQSIRNPQTAQNIRESIVYVH
ncbi:MAG: nucleotidyltransferase family protein [Anaerolineae bacterium]